MIREGKLYSAVLTIGTGVTKQLRIVFIQARDFDDAHAKARREWPDSCIEKIELTVKDGILLADD